MQAARPGAPRARQSLTPVAVAAAALLHAGASAQEAAADPPVALKSTPMLSERFGGNAGGIPSFLSGERSFGRTEQETVVEGKAELRRGNTVIRADRLEYNQADDTARALGNVYINREGDVFEGPELELKVDRFEGFFLQPRYRLLRNDAYGSADRIDFIDDRHTTVRNANYTTCRRDGGPDWLPAWILKAATIKLDTEEEVGEAHNAVLRFHDVPILASPYLTFPLSERRKSGLLPPTVGIDNLSGVEITQPYYWNIAPNRDATFFPALLARRGVDLGGEFRYLEADYRGTLRGSFMPHDKLRDRSRWGYSVQHTGFLPTGIEPLGRLGINVNLNRVSDDDYWRDFSRSGASLTQRLLTNDASLSWSQGKVSVLARTLKWQALQDPDDPITPPYDRLPQLQVAYDHNAYSGLNVRIEGDYSRFRGGPTTTFQPDAQRTYALAQVSYPLRAPGWFFVPKAQLHTRHYEFDSPLVGGATQASRTVPIYSLDGGLVFEREATLFGTSFRQTLEPRAFYVYAPYRNQNLLPVYDTIANDFNFTSIFTENAFSGNDRIADNNLLTLGLSTRLLNVDTGAEAARFGIAQRFRFSNQNVQMPGSPAAVDELSDVLIGMSLNIDPRWSFDTTVQYNPKIERSERSVISARYTPSNYRVLSAAYRFQRNRSEQIDVGWQWPLNDLWGDRGTDLGPGKGLGDGRWYSVGRLNWSLRDRRLVDTVVGLEYDAGCWLGRMVFERLQTTENKSNKRILLQLELVGLTRLGSNPLKTLSQSIPRYQFLREQVATPSRFSNYD